MKIEYININELKEYEKNAKEHPQEQIDQIAASIKEFGNNDPIAIDENNTIIEGHGRLFALKQLGYEEVPVIRLEHMTDDQKRAYIIAHNKLTINSGFDLDTLRMELNTLEDDLQYITGFTDEELDEIFEDLNIESKNNDTLPEVKEDSEIITKKGDIWILDGKHKILNGDTLDPNSYKLLFEEDQKVDLVFTDPPYGMKKEADGVLNDNLNYNELLEFNRTWIGIQMKYLKDNGSFYIWGIDEPLMDIYSGILKPLILDQKITFRNLITWTKGVAQGQNTEEFRMYPREDEKCLFFMTGVQGFNTNQDNYYEGWEPIRKYLADNISVFGGSGIWREILGNTMGKHYFTKSQWSMPTRENYEKMQEYARSKNKDVFKKEYDEIKKEYDEIKKEWYSTRAYFNNTHDQMTNVWRFTPTSKSERETVGGHATPKPIKLCKRGIRTSSRRGELVFDGFLGSGSTLIAAEELNRTLYGIELDERFTDVIILRYIQYKNQMNQKYQIKLIRDGQEIELEDTGLLELLEED